MNANPSPKPVLYFDGDCPVCSREIAMYRSQAGAENVCWVDAARCTVDDLGPGLTRDAALARLHLRRPDGSLVSGAAAFTTLWLALPKWAWLGKLLGSGIALRLFETGYRAFLVIRLAWRKKDLKP